ncbi:MAG: hypothetical protein V4736_13410 [Bdellovibrionota bacterium]
MFNLNLVLKNLFPVLILVAPVWGQAQSACNQALLKSDSSLEVSNFTLEQIAKTDRVLRSDLPGFETKRPLWLYAETLPLFWEFFAPKAGGKIHWLNVGGGALVAEGQFLKKYGTKDTSVTSINVETPRENAAGEIDTILRNRNLDPSLFTHLSGRKLREIPNEELAGITGATDLQSAMVYSERPDLELQKFSEILPEGAPLIFFVPKKYSMGLRDKAKGSSGYDSTITEREYDQAYPDGILEYLKAVKGFEMVKTKVVDLNGTPGFGIALKRTSDKFFAPSLELDYFTDSRPPVRGFLWDRKTYGKKFLGIF